MYFISHRGNVDGKNSNYENSLDYILNASKKFNVEVDVWYYKNNFYFGHDEPLYLINNDLLIKIFDKKKFWFHAKNFEALDKLKILKKANFFWHQNDDYTITNKGFFWTYPGKKLLKKSICVLPETYTKQKIFDHVSGICSDSISKYKNTVFNF